MYKKYSKLFLLLVFSSATTTTYAEKSIGYWYDTSGDIVRTGFGDCWRTIRWTPDNALAECKGTISSEPAKQSDSDNDGVIDSIDRCPATAAGTTVDNRGCTIDSDNDGIVDANDRCPDTAAGIKVDTSGCNKDSDKDGIADTNDDCPNTIAGTVVNSHGCKLQANLNLDNVQFKTGTAVLGSSSKTILDNVAATLNSNQHLNFEVAGHTDNTGNYQNNVSLSERRANSVRQYLINKGVVADRLSAKGYGPDKPVANNDTHEGRSRNRRVELVLQ